MTLVQIQIQIRIQIQIQKPSLRNAKFEISSLLENKLTLQRKCSWFNWHWSRPARSNWSTFASNWSIFWIGQYSKFENISSESIFWIGQYVAPWGLFYGTWVRPLRGLVTNLLTQLKILLNDATLADEYATSIAVEIIADGNFVIFAGIFAQQFLVGEIEDKKYTLFIHSIVVVQFPWSTHILIFSSKC